MPKYDDEDYNRLKSCLRINRDMLDAEVISQANDYFHASEGTAFSTSRRDHAKHDLEVELATLDKDVRDAAAADGEKITENQVKAQIAREPDYHTAHRKYLSACLEADRWEALKNAFRQRADMLRSLVQMYQTNYYGDVSGAAERRDARDRSFHGRQDTR